MVSGCADSFETESREIEPKKIAVTFVSRGYYSSSSITLRYKYWIKVWARKRVKWTKNTAISLLSLSGDLTSPHRTIYKARTPHCPANWCRHQCRQSKMSRESFPNCRNKGQSDQTEMLKRSTTTFWKVGSLKENSNGFCPNTTYTIIKEFTSYLFWNKFLNMLMASNLHTSISIWQIWSFRKK